jgi:acetyltransferase-like isoleucine patch superfamily enzyme
MSNHPKLYRAQIRDVEFGVNCGVVEPVNLYGCKIGDDCFIGPFVEIQKGVIVGNRCKIHSHALVCELVTIGDDCVISHGVMFINDPFSTGGPAHRNKTLWKPTSIGDHVSIGTNATILPVRICSRVVIGAGSVVTKDIFVSGVYAGNPVKLLRKFECD